MTRSLTRLAFIPCMIWCHDESRTNAQMLYWTDRTSQNDNLQRIRRIDRDGLRLQDVRVTEQQPISTVVDELNSKVYWIEYQSSCSTIFRANLDGTDLESVIEFTQPWPKPFGIAVDPSRKLYWTQQGSMANLIRRSNLDGTEVETVPIASMGRPTEITFDPIASKLYWAEQGDRIRQANHDGSNAQTIFVEPEHVITDLAVLPGFGHIYWVDANSGIYRINQDGLGFMAFPEGQDCDHVLGIAIDSAFDGIYWTCTQAAPLLPYRLRMARLDGSSPMDLYVQYAYSATPILGNIAIAPSFGKLFLAVGSTNPSSGKIQSTTLPPASEETLVSSGFNGPRSIALDIDAGKMYWTDAYDLELPNMRGRIFRANLDGSEQETLSDETPSAPFAIALHGEGQKMYWTDYIGGTVARANLDGTGREIIATEGEAHPAGIALDQVQQKVYWTVQEEFLGGGAIRRSNLDGSQIENILVSPELPTSFPGHIALDLVRNKMYWVSFFGRVLILGSQINRSDLDGSNLETIELEPDDVCCQVSISLYVDAIGEKLYVTEGGFASSEAQIVSTELDGTQKQLLYNGGVRYPSGIALNSSFQIVMSVPPHGAIDARQPHDIHDPAISYGWNSIDLTFSGAIEGIGSTNFSVVEQGGSGDVPAVTGVQIKSNETVRVVLGSTIEPGAWTCVHHIQSGTKGCVGYLPGDVNGDGTTTPVDILALIDSLNGINVLADYATDINRDGTTAPADILREIDLLNGADAFDPWLGRSLP